MAHPQHEEHMKLARHIYSYLVLGNTNKEEGIVRNIKYKFEHLGQTLDGHWTILNIFNVHNKDVRIFSSAIIATLYLLENDLKIVEKFWVDQIAYNWVFDKCTPFMSARIRFANGIEERKTIEG